MKRENAAWVAIGFLAALLMGAMAAPSAEPGRWQLIYDTGKPIGGAGTLLLDTATGGLWALPAPDEQVPAEKGLAIRKAWFEIGPAR